MATTMQVVFRPIADNQRSGEMVIDPDGIGFREVVAGACDGAPEGNNLIVMQALLQNTVQPSTAQKNGLIDYLAAIQAAVDTSTVETAIAALP